MEAANNIPPQLNRDFAALKFEAAVLYIKEGTSVVNISYQLKISKSKVNQWVKEGRWSELRLHPNAKVMYYPSTIALQEEAMKLYIKHGLSADAICKQLNIAMQTFAKWRKAGRWDDLRPDMEILTHYKAAVMYVGKGMTTGEIAQELSTPEVIIKAWIDIYGWDAARLVNEAQDVTIDIVANFCSFFKQLLPKETAEVEFAQGQYLKKIRKLNL